MYQISQAMIMAMKVPTIRSMNWYMLCPAVGVIEMATMIIAHTSRC
jgi:hypothetical protein